MQQSIPKRSHAVPAGNLTDLLYLQKDSGVEDEGGGHPENPWQTVAQDFFALRPASANERYIAEQRKMVVTHLAYSRWRSDITIDSSLRLFWPSKNRIFAVHGVINEDMANRLMVWRLEEVAGED